MYRVLAVCICLWLGAVSGHAATVKPAATFAQSLSEADAARVAGRWADAVTLYKKALFVQPEHAEARFHLACALRQTERYYEARRHFRLALQARVQDRAWVSQCRLQLAACWEATGDYREAAGEYRLALVSDEGCKEAKSGQARALAQAGSGSK